jgi:hypothetical protein
MNYQIFFLLFALSFWVNNCGIDDELKQAISTEFKQAKATIKNSGPIYMVGLTSATLLPRLDEEQGAKLYALGSLSPSSHLAYLQFDPDTSEAKIAAFLQEAQEAGELTFAELNATYELYHSSLFSPAEEVEGGFKSFNLLDQLYQHHEAPWWLNQIKLPYLVNTLAQREKQLGLGDSLAKTRPIVAVIDSGSDLTHPALMAHALRNPVAGQAGCDNDTWGCDTTRGEGTLLGVGPALPFLTTKPGEKCPKAVTSSQQLRRSSCVHGTHVAGIIVGDSEQGVDGICPTCQILPVKVVEEMDGQGRVTDLAFIRALQYIRNLNKLLPEKIRIVNFSFGKFQWSLAVAKLIAEMRREGILFIAAAGNENVNEKVFPAALPGVVAVTAVDKLGRKSGYANFGSWVDIAAPGGHIERSERQGILSAAPGGEFYYSQGTSVASPVVAAVAGLLLSLDPSMSSDALRERLVASADRRLYDGDFALGYNERYYRYDQQGRGMPLLGAGLVDVEAAWKYQAGGPSSEPEPEEKSKRRRSRLSCGSLGLSSTLPPSGPTSNGQSLVFLAIPLLCLGLRPILGRRQSSTRRV